MERKEIGKKKNIFYTNKYIYTNIYIWYIYTNLYQI